MSRRAKKRHSERAPVSGTLFSNERSNQRKKRRVGRREQERRTSEARLAVVPSEVDGAPPASALPVAPGSAELSSSRALARLRPAANPAAEHPLADDAWLDVEHAFFEGWSASEPTPADLVATESPPAPDDGDSVLLTSEEQQRRRWFRRQVTRLVAGLGAFATVAVAVRVASLL